ncbi:MAG: methionyl-tRNA formyltransferase [Ruminococcaceae bacterium]|nr:methionyl-tRNA formyltransferase [Oscillospiraceae bacterium]
MRVLYMGTPDFAATVLEGIYKAGYEIAGVISQPDKPKNRGMHMEPTAVKKCAGALGLPVYQPETLRDKAILPYLEEVQPDIIMVVAYGKLLPEYVLTFPKHGCVNMHASLLPKYRGAAPIQWSILNGEAETGVTAMYMEKGLDTGDMICKSRVEIKEDDTAETLHDTLAAMAARLAVETLESIENGTIVREKQDDALSTYAPLLTKELGKINWTKTTRQILDKIRGLFPWPGAYSYKDGQLLKIIRAKSAEGSGTPGTVLSGRGKLIIATGDGAVEILELQPAGKKKMTAQAYLAGNPMEKGTLLVE